MKTKNQKNKKQYLNEDRDWNDKKPRLEPYKKSKRKINKNSIEQFIED